MGSRCKTRGKIKKINVFWAGSLYVLKRSRTTFIVSFETRPSITNNRIKRYKLPLCL